MKFGCPDSPGSAPAPHTLVEASVDGKWGGGGGGVYGSDTYEQGIVPGKNIFGDMVTTYRDQRIMQKKSY